MQSVLFVRFEVLTSVLTGSDYVGCDAVIGISSSHAPIFRVMQLKAKALCFLEMLRTAEETKSWCGG